MSPRRQPKPLFQQCVSFLSSAVDALCRQHVQPADFHQLAGVVSYVQERLPARMQAILGDAIHWKSERMQQALMPTQVKLLLRLYTRRLAILGSVVESGVLENETGTSLRDLSLFYIGCQERAIKLNTFLHTANNLTHLRCTDFCNDNMIEIIASSCHHLHTLELRACSVTDEGVLKLCGLTQSLRQCIEILSKGGTLVPTSRCAVTLRELILQMTRVTEAGVAVITLVLTNIELLRVPDIRMVQVFNFLQTIDHKNLQCNLKEFHSREILDEFQLSVLTGLCPNLEYIQVSLVGNLDMDLIRLEKLTRLSKLSRAKLADVHSDALMWFLEQIGSQMKHLYLYTYHTKMSQEKISITRRHLKGLAMYCPNLESFVFEGYSLSEEASPPTIPGPTSLQYFHNLHTLNLSSMNLSEEDLKMFLQKCRNMRILELVLQNPHVLQDKLINELLDEGVWRNLTKVRILNSPITCQVMNRLVLECPNLQVLGCLFTWLVPKRQVIEFQERVRRDNLDIEVY